jgi:hypothetical protein
MTGRQRAAAFMSRAALKKIISFLKRSGAKEARILGGEPTLHPAFGHMADMILEAGLDIQLFTNGLMPDRVREYLRRQGRGRVRMLLNINDQSAYSREQDERLKTTLEALNDKITLGYNIYGAEFDIRFAARYIDEYKLQRAIRLGLAAPVYGRRNAYLPLRDHRRVAERIVEFARLFDRRDISFTFDCGFRLCSFTDKQIGELYYCNSPLRTTCKPVFDVSPGLKVWRCFATSLLHSADLRDFRDERQLNEYFDRKFQALAAIGAHDTCRSCKHFKRGQCHGGCLGYTLASFHKAENVQEECRGR